MLQAISERAHFNAECDFYETMTTPTKSHKRYLVEATIEIALEVPVIKFKELVCQHFGHKWVGIGYGITESGVMGCECERCGEEHSTILY